MPADKNLNNNSSDYGFKNMPQPQKTAVIALSIFGVAIIFFGALQFRERVSGPFSPKNGEAVNTENPIDLMNLDTDKDGLSDYDESNIYKTSRYLEDTDSDGISDKAETIAGSDPLCPAGQNCISQNDFGIISTSSEAAQAAATSSDNGLGSINISDGTSESDLQNVLAGQVDAATLRRVLIESGADKTTLDQISDEDLLKSYQEVLNKQNE